MEKYTVPAETQKQLSPSPPPPLSSPTGGFVSPLASSSSLLKKSYQESKTPGSLRIEAFSPELQLKSASKAAAGKQHQTGESIESPTSISAGAEGLLLSSSSPSTKPYHSSLAASNSNNNNIDIINNNNSGSPASPGRESPSIFLPFSASPIEQQRPNETISQNLFSRQETPSTSLPALPRSHPPPPLASTPSVNKKKGNSLLSKLFVEIEASSSLNDCLALFETECDGDMTEIAEKINSTYLGWTALFKASLAGRTDIVEALLDFGALVSSKSAYHNGWTPLHAAVERKDAVSCLLVHRRHFFFFVFIC